MSSARGRAGRRARRSISRGSGSCRSFPATTVPVARPTRHSAVAGRRGNLCREPGRARPSGFRSRGLHRAPPDARRVASFFCSQSVQGSPVVASPSGRRPPAVCPQWCVGDRHRQHGRQRARRHRGHRSDQRQDRDRGAPPLAQPGARGAGAGDAEGHPEQRRGRPHRRGRRARLGLLPATERQNRCGRARDRVAQSSTSGPGI